MDFSSKLSYLEYKVIGYTFKDELSKLFDINPDPEYNQHGFDKVLEDTFATGEVGETRETKIVDMFQWVHRALLEKGIIVSSVDELAEYCRSFCMSVLACETAMYECSKEVSTRHWKFIPWRPQRAQEDVNIRWLGWHVEPLGDHFKWFHFELSFYVYDLGKNWRDTIIWLHSEKKNVKGHLGNFAEGMKKLLKGNGFDVETKTDDERVAGSTITGGTSTYATGKYVDDTIVPEPTITSYESTTTKEDIEEADISEADLEVKTEEYFRKYVIIADERGTRFFKLPPDIVLRFKPEMMDYIRDRILMMDKLRLTDDDWNPDVIESFVEEDGKMIKKYTVGTTAYDNIKDASLAARKIEDKLWGLAGIEMAAKTLLKR